MMPKPADKKVSASPAKVKDMALKRAFQTLLLTTRSTFSLSDAANGANVADADDSPGRRRPLRQQDQQDVERPDVDDQEVLSNTRWFFLEENDNYDVSEQLVDYELENVIMDPSNPPSKGCNTPYIRWLTLRYVIQQLFFRALTMLLILLDLVLIVIDLIINCPPDSTSRIIGAIDMAISCYFILEITTRIFALQPKVFFSRRNWFNTVDFLVVILTFAISLSYIITIETWIAKKAFNGCQPSQDLKFLNFAKVMVLFRFLRFIRLVRLVRLYTEHHQIKRAIRQTVSQNKRRYQTDGHDLDLTYVTQRVIAMSFPSSGLRAWYRNPIREVAHFLDKHHKDHYRVYNLCSERTYDDSFFHNRVFHWKVDDHNVPSVSEMVSFVSEVNAWLSLDPLNVVAVHCKGGKGRTGTMICVLLVDLGIFHDAQHSLEYFGQRRTDRNVSSQFQGVETASQIRYVDYFERLKRIPGVDYPEKVGLAIDEIRITGLKTVGKGDGSDLSFNVSLGRAEPVYSADLSRKGDWQSRYDAEGDYLTITVPNCPKLVDDVRIKFFCSSSSVPRGYEKCAFYFWFHTFFVAQGNVGSDSDESAAAGDQNGDQNGDLSRQLSLRREEIDNPHKEKTWKIFQADFSVQIRFKLLQTGAN